MFIPQLRLLTLRHLLKEKIYNNVEGQKILIIRGEGGRETLKNALEEKRSYCKLW